MTTIGKELLKGILPQDVWPLVEAGPIDKKAMIGIMAVMAEKHPDQYKDTLQKLHDLGEEVARFYGGPSSLNHQAFETPKQAQMIRVAIQGKIDEILANDNLNSDQRRAALLEVMTKGKERMDSALKEMTEDNPFVLQLKSGARGSIKDMQAILTGPISADTGWGDEFPVMHGYAEGLTPAEYWTTGYGSRLGYIGTKLATPVAGHIANQIMLAAQRLRVTENDDGSLNGIPIDPNDSDYEGSILARDYPGIAPRGTIMTPKIMRQLARRHDEVMIKSPITSEAEHGIDRLSAGAYPEMSEIGDYIGVTAAQALTEPISQSSISSKHRAGQRQVSGTDLIKQLIEVPTTFQGAAALAEEPGVVSGIEETGTGGKRIVIGKNKYPLEPGIEPIVKIGDAVDRGDTLSQGMPNPADMTRLLGVGVARRRFVDEFSQALKEAGIGHNKRNIEFIATALINHAQITKPYQNYLPGDIVEFSALTRHWEPREGAKEVPTSQAKGMYLEKPSAHYSIGTQLNGKDVKWLQKMGYDNVLAHSEPPPFEPVMKRAMETSKYSDDFIDRLSGYYSRGSLFDSLYNGRAQSDPSNPEAMIPQIVLSGNIMRMK